MATRKEFCDAMEEVYRNHGMYVGTANGERTLDIAGKFFEMEKNYGRRDTNGNPLWFTDAARDYEFLGKCYRNHYDMSKSLAGDCSGIIVGIMRMLGIIKPNADYRAKDFQAKATKVPLKDVQPADLVFDKEKDATHVGAVVSRENDTIYIIDSRGRDKGVIRTKISSYPWVVGGRLDWFSDEIPVLTRNLRYIKDNMMRGEDVKLAQERLNIKGCDAGFEDGIFGIKTMDATIEFQAENHLEIDGVIGQKTWAKLWEN